MGFCTRQFVQYSPQHWLSNWGVWCVALACLWGGSARGDIICEGEYRHHLQGICVDETSIFWCFTTTMVKTDFEGRVQSTVEVANHHGDLCYADGKVYVAVNLGKFNQPAGKADSWVYVYDAKTMEELSRHEVQEVVHGAGAMESRDGKFFVMGGLPEGYEENYVYEYDENFKFVKRHVIASGYTRLGIQTGTFANNRWYFGCYGSPAVLLVTDEKFQLKGRYEYNCSLGIVALPDGRFLSATGGKTAEGKQTGKARYVVPDQERGFRPVAAK